MPADNPKVTIGLPVYNGADFLEEAIRSVLDQEFGDLELVVSDNGSEDGTRAICERYAAADPRVRYHRFDTNQGAARNYNKTFELARGEYFKWAAHDDVCYPRFLSACVHALETAPPEVVLAYPRADFIDAEGQTLRSDSDSLQTLDPSPRRRMMHVVRRVNMANAVFGLIRSDALRKTRLIDTFIASDYVLLVELALLGQLLEVPEVLFLRRVHEKSSREANLSNRSVRRWFDPSKENAWSLPPRPRLVWEYMRSAFRMPLSPWQKLTCALSTPVVFYIRRARIVAGRYKRKLKQLVLQSKKS